MDGPARSSRGHGFLLMRPHLLYLLLTGPDFVCSPAQSLIPYPPMVVNNNVASNSRKTRSRYTH